MKQVRQALAKDIELYEWAKRHYHEQWERPLVSCNAHPHSVAAPPSHTSRRANPNDVSATAHTHTHTAHRHGPQQP